MVANSEFCGSLLVKPPAATSIEFWVDASSSWGIGIIINNEWDHGEFAPIGTEMEGILGGWKL